MDTVLLRAAGGGGLPPLGEQPGHHSFKLLLCCTGEGLWVQVSFSHGCLLGPREARAGAESLGAPLCCAAEQSGGRALPLSLPRVTPGSQLLAGQRAALSWGPGGAQGWTGCLSLVRSPALQLNLALAP